MSADKASSEERKAFKNWFDRSAARALADQMAQAMPDFDQTRFVRLATRKLDSLEFAGRVKQFSDALAATLSESVPDALGTLTHSLPEPLAGCDETTDGWLQWPVGQFIADHGLDHFEESMTAMVELTKRFSSEFAVRSFVEHRPQETFERLLALTADENPHVRRWCSEGTRSRLPWGRRLQHLVDDPSPILPILEALKDDEELYVRRSVANSLNDISKDHPDLAIEMGRAWSKKSSEHRQWIVKHALRTLIKAGDADALAIVGFGQPTKLKAALCVRPKRIAIGGSVELTAELSNGAARTQHLMVDYVVHYVRQRGQSSEKVFKWKSVELSARSSTTLTKKHAMRLTTIRALYPGMHRVQLQVNGVRVGETRFRLTG